MAEITVLDMAMDIKLLFKHNAELLGRISNLWFITPRRNPTQLEMDALAMFAIDLMKRVNTLDRLRLSSKSSSL